MAKLDANIKTFFGCWEQVSEITQEVIDNPKVNKETKEWLHKKAIKHVGEVVHVVHKMIANDDFMKSINMPPREAYAKLSMIAAFHDLGRAAEVDIENGFLKKGFDHAFASYDIMKDRLGITDPQILLPVKYHGCLNLMEALGKDPEYQNLPDNEKQTVLAFSHIIRDADKIANMEEKAYYGFKGSLEERDPNLSDKCEISPELEGSILSKKQVKNGDRKTRVDAMLRIAGWTFDLKTPYAKQYVKENKIIDKIFGQVDNLMQTAKDKTSKEGSFNQETYDKTARKLKILQGICKSSLYENTGLQRSPVTNGKTNG